MKRREEKRREEKRREEKRRYEKRRDLGSHFHSQFFPYQLIFFHMTLPLRSGSTFEHRSLLTPLRPSGWNGEIEKGLKGCY